MKKKQEKDFLNHLQELDILDKERYKNGKKAIDDDFISLNERIKREN